MAAQKPGGEERAKGGTTALAQEFDALLSQRKNMIGLC